MPNAKRPFCFILVRNGPALLAKEDVCLQLSLAVWIGRFQQAILSLPTISINDQCRRLFSPRGHSFAQQLELLSQIIKRGHCIRDRGGLVSVMASILQVNSR